MPCGRTGYTQCATFSTKRYKKRWPLIPLDILNHSRATVPSPYDEEGGDRWLLFIPEDEKELWGKEDAGGARTFTCRMCQGCVGRVAQKHPELPGEAIANDRWGGPVPPEIGCLSYAEKKIMQRARTYLDIKRAATSRIRKTSAQQWTSQGKTPMSYLQEPERLLSSCMLLPEELCDTLSVQFTGGNREAIRADKSLQVSVARLRAAFEWLVRHNPHWSSFGELQPDGRVKMSPAVHNLLLRYRAPDGSESPVVPEAVSRAVCPLMTTTARIAAAAQRTLLLDRRAKPAAAAALRRMTWRWQSSSLPLTKSRQLRFGRLHS